MTTTLEGLMDNWAGYDLERRMHGNIVYIAGWHLGLGHVRIIQSVIVALSVEFQDIIEDAATQNRITYQQADHLMQTDIIVSARRRSDRREVQVAFEISRSIADHDIVRASQRANTLSIVMESQASRQRSAAASRRGSRNWRTGWACLQSYCPNSRADAGGAYQRS